MRAKAQQQDGQGNASQVEHDAPAREELKQNPDSFSGIYEALFGVANGTSIRENEVISEWKTRMSYLNNCPNIQKHWLPLFENYESLSPGQQKKGISDFLSFIFSAGIKRDDRSQLIVDKKTQFQYYALNGEEFTAGGTMKIMLPCWTFDGTILEKGMLTSP